MSLEQILNIILKPIFKIINKCISAGDGGWVLQCRAAGLKTAVASSADRVKVDANLAAAGLPQEKWGGGGNAEWLKLMKGK